MFDINRRQRPRFVLTIDGYYYNNNKWEKCRIHNLNLEGAGINLHNSFSIGDTIKIKLDESDKHIFETMVVNFDSRRIGIKFTKLGKTDIDFLKKIINDYSDRYKIK